MIFYSFLRGKLQLTFQKANFVGDRRTQEWGKIVSAAASSGVRSAERCQQKDRNPDLGSTFPLHRVSCASRCPWRDRPREARMKRQPIYYLLSLWFFSQLAFSRARFASVSAASRGATRRPR